MTLVLRSASAAALLVLVVLGASSAASAHTAPDHVAVPAGTVATVNFKPTHGCGGSPTVEVSVRAPVEGATAGAVEGWTGSATPDGEGNTVLAWTGGVLPSDETGRFPITFTAPDAVGDLLTFASIQTCENGEELAWISGDPDSEYPAPRLLLLPGGADPARTIADVPADAPGRDQLTEIVDVDAPGPQPPTSPTTDPVPTTTSGADGDPGQDDAAAEEPAPVEPAPADGDGGGSSVLVPLIVVVALGGIGVAYFVLRRRPAA